MSDAPPAGLPTASLRRRLVVAVLVLLTALLVVLSVTVDRVLTARTEGQLEQRLLDRVAVAQALADQVSAADLVRRIGGEGVSVQLTTTDGEVLTAGPRTEVPAGAQPAPTPRADGPGRKPAPAPAQVVRSGDVYSIERTLPVGELVLATDAGGLRQTLSQVRVVLAASSLGVLLLAVLLVGLLTGRVLRPLETMTSTARSIAEGDRGRRLHPDRPGTELGRMAGAFDEMLDAVEGAEDRARAAEARVREFALEAAHELRTPLAGVQASAEALLVGRPDRAERERLLAGVVREARRAARLADDLLLMARIDRGVELERRPVDLGELAAQVAGSAGSRAGAPVDVDAPAPAVVAADPDRVTQILTNLVDNARRAAGPDGRVGIAVGPQGRVVVADDGPGVPVADRERVFERLVRLDAARSRDRGGAGLGLAIARGLARAHGGDLRILDTTRGAAFELTLP